MERKGFTKEESLALKGIAILLMIFVHCFSEPWWYAGFSINFFPFVEERVNRMASFGGICVGIFAFISGYRLSAALEHYKGSSTSFCLQRYMKSMRAFYPVLAICLLAGVILDNHTAETYMTGGVESLYNLVIQGLGLSYLFGTPMFVHEWWYLSAMVLFIFLTPVFAALVKQYGWAVTLCLWIAVPRVTGAGYGHPIYGFSITLLLGTIFYRYQVFEYIHKFLTENFAGKKQILKSVLALCVLLFCYKLYIIGPGIAYDEIHTTLVPLMFILCFKECVLCYSCVRRVFAFLGKHSANMYFIHTVFSSLYLHKFLFSLPWFVLTPMAVCLISLVFSMVLEAGKSCFYEKVYKPIVQNRPTSPLDWLREYWRSESFRSLVSPCLFAMTMLLLDMGLRSLHSGVGITTVFDPIPWQFTLSWVVMLTTITLLLPRVLRKIAIGAMGGIFLILFLTHSMMMQAKGNFFSFNSLMYAADGFRFLDASYIQVGLWIWFVFFLGLLMVILSALLAPQKGAGIRQIIICLVLIVVGIGSINNNREKNLTDRLQNHFNIYQNSLLYDNFTDPNSCLMLCGMYQYTFRDFCVTYGVYDSFNQMKSHDTIAALDDWYESRELDEDNDWTGRFAGKNLIMIQLEAIDSWMLNEQFMPNLYLIQQESINFINHYAPMYSDAGTFNTEMIANTGMVAPFVGAKSSMYSRNNYPYSLANLMALDGCKVNSFHRSSSDTYNRGVIHVNWGYEQYYSGADMGISSDRLDFDTELMQAYDLIAPADERFFSFIITYSAHGPYEHSAVSDYYYDTAENLLPEDTDEMIVHAMARAKVTDEFIGQLYDCLEADGLLDNTVLVFYSDHYDYYVQKRDLILEIKGVENFDMASNIPFFIYEKGTLPEKITKVTSSIDILPTLVNLFDLDTDGRYYVGNDALSPNGGYVIFQNLSWYDGKTYWNTIASEEMTPEIQARNEEVKRRLEMSWDSMRINYLYLN